MPRLTIAGLTGLLTIAGLSTVRIRLPRPAGGGEPSSHDVQPVLVRLAMVFTAVAIIASCAPVPDAEADRGGTIAPLPYHPTPGTNMAARTVAQAPAPSDALASLFEGGPWLGTRPLKPEDVRGKVVLVNFWTYSCINVLRAMPYVRTWAQKYRNHGLVVVGVHTPEFAFEKDVANVRTAVPTLGIRYPVVLDNDAAIWRGFNNQVWPALYLIGADGRIRDHQLGEGGYDRLERTIQQLLSEATGAQVDMEIAEVNGEGVHAAADWRNLRSEETYIGYQQARNFVDPASFRPDASTFYRAATALPLNGWSLGGAWTIGSEFASLDGKSGRLNHRFRARDLHLVLAPPPDGRPIRFRVRLNGAAPGADHGVDVDAEGWGTVKEARMYQLVRQQGRIADRTFEVEFFENGVRAYAFTFG